MKVLGFLTALLFTSLLSTAHAGSYAPAISNVANNVILKTYVNLAAGAKTLQDRVQILAQQPTAENFAAAQQAWRDMRVHWEASEAFLFGPVDSLSIDPTIDTWPLNLRDLDSVLNSNRALTVDFVRALAPGAQGFHVAEFLLFGLGVTGPNKTVAELTPRQLEYLQATCALLTENTAKLTDAWVRNADPDHPNEPGYVQFLSSPGPKNRYFKTETAVLVQLTEGIVAILDEVGNAKLADPMGGDIGAANPSLVESPFSWNSLADFSNNIRSVLNVYTGAYDGNAGPGLRDVLRTKNAKLAADVEQRINQSIQIILAIAGPANLDFRQAIADPAGRVRVEAAIQDLNDLKKLVDNKVLPIMRDIED